MNILSIFLKKFIHGVIQRKHQEKTLLETRSIPKPKKKFIQKHSKEILEAWYRDNIMHPYASISEMNELHLLTGFEHIRIKRWLENRRIKQSKTETKPRKLFTPGEKSILLDFFNNNSNHHGPADISVSANLVGKDSKKIESWFSRQRFLKKTFKKNDFKLK